MDGLCCILQKSISTLDRCVGTDYQDYSLEVLTAKLREHFGSTSNFKFSFFERIVDSWNSFPFNVHHSGNIRKSSTVNFFFQVIIFCFYSFWFYVLVLIINRIEAYCYSWWNAQYGVAGYFISSYGPSAFVSHIFYWHPLNVLYKQSIYGWDRTSAHTEKIMVYSHCVENNSKVSFQSHPFFFPTTFAQKCKVIYERDPKSHGRYITFAVYSPGDKRQKS